MSEIVLAVLFGWGFVFVVGVAVGVTAWALLRVADRWAGWARLGDRLDEYERRREKERWRRR